MVIDRSDLTWAMLKSDLDRYMHVTLDQEMIRITSDTVINIGLFTQNAIEI